MNDMWYDVSQLLVIATTILVAAALVCYIVASLTSRNQVESVQRQKVASGRAGGVATLDRDPVNPAATARRAHGVMWYAEKLNQLGLIALTISLIARSIVTGHGPFTNQYEFAVSFAWGIIAAYAYFEWRYKVRLLAIVTLPVALALLLYADTLDASVKPLIPALQNNFLLTLHVATAMIAYGAAAVSFGAAVLYLLQPRLANSPLARLTPRRELFDELGYRAAVFSYPFLTVMIVLGAIWADIAWGRYWSWDPKETAALVTWLIYGAYLHARVSRGWRGDRSAWLLIVAFIAVMLTYFGNLFFGGLHAYA
ncbi:MAG: c-type cytochrome biogenesis protein CcsB [Dermatophilus congolensis]|nr:c-type cytochrome biogenesis protein CcsB [Dermatophilus congolensis]